MANWAVSPTASCCFGPVIFTLTGGVVAAAPGPGAPRDAGISQAVVHELNGEIPILGVCLGPQCIGAEFGGPVVPAERPLHGRVSHLAHTGERLFEGLPQQLTVGRYHSLIVERSTLPACLEVTAWTSTGIIMGLRHREFPTVGVQFHPESIATDHGKQILANFLKMQV